MAEFSPSRAPATGEDDVVVVYGVRAHGDCGYCGGGPSVSFALRTPSLAPQDYEDLVNRGWARAGRRLYKPVMHETCCPQYTIRLDTRRFQASKSQRAVLKAMARFLHHGSTKAQQPPPPPPSSSPSSTSSPAAPSAESPVARLRSLPAARQENSRPKAAGVDVEAEALRQKLVAAACTFVASLPIVWRPGCRGLEDALCKVWDMELKERLRKVKVFRNTRRERGTFSSNIALVVASHLRRIPHTRRGEEGFGADTIAREVLAMTDLPAAGCTVVNGFINITAEPCMTVPQERSDSKEHGDVNPAEKPPEASPFQGQKRKLSQVSDEPSSQRSEETEDGKEHVLTIETKRPECTPELFDLYFRYQTIVHGDNPDEVTESGCRRFIADSPLFDPASPHSPHDISSIVRVVSNGSELDVVPCDAAGNVVVDAVEQPVPDGSYHQLFRLDGKLIAVNVVDVTATAFSSLYCFYDPAYRHLTLGKFCALMEIEWMRRHAAATRPGLRYYFMGYYVHSCPKMRYKTDFKPTEALCPTSYTWHPIEKCLPIFERFRFSPLDPCWAAVRARHRQDTGQRPMAEWQAGRNIELQMFAPFVDTDLATICRCKDAIVEELLELAPWVSAFTWRRRLNVAVHELIEQAGPTVAKRIIVRECFKHVMAELAAVCAPTSVPPSAPEKA